MNLGENIDDFAKHQTNFILKLVTYFTKWGSWEGQYFSKLHIIKVMNKVAKTTKAKSANYPNYFGGPRWKQYFPLGVLCTVLHTVWGAKTSSNCGVRKMTNFCELQLLNHLHLILVIFNYVTIFYVPYNLF